MLDCLLGLCLLVAGRFDYFPPEPETATLAFTGDNKLQGRTARAIERHGEDYPYAAVVELLSAADLAFGNLECPITDAALPTAGKSAESISAGTNFVFKSSPEYSARILAEAGFDVLSLANNHMMDYRAAGLEQTMSELDAHGIAVVGAGPDRAGASAPVVLECDGLRVAYLAYSLVVPAQSQAGPHAPGINTLSQNYRSALERAITPLHGQADVIVCSFHWGTESSANAAQYQIDIAHAAVEAGADLVIGHHPHCLQGFEFYRDGLIAYSLGNFQFSGPSHKLASCILTVEAGAEGIATVQLIPVWLHDGRPEPAADDALLQQLKRHCRDQSLQFEVTEQGWLALRPVAPPAVQLAPASTS